MVFSFDRSSAIMVSTSESEGGQGRLRFGPTAAALISGTAGGVAQVIVGHPFNTIKARLQSSPPGIFSSALDCLGKTIRSEVSIAEALSKSVWVMGDRGGSAQSFVKLFLRCFVILGGRGEAFLWLLPHSSYEKVSQGRQKRSRISEIRFHLLVNVIFESSISWNKNVLKHEG